MCRVERGGDLQRDVQCFPQSKWFALQAVAQRFTFDQFGGDKTRVFKVANLVDVQNVRMIKRRSGFGFLYKTTHPVFISATSASNTFSATCRSRSISWARYTSPIPLSRSWRQCGNAKRWYWLTGYYSPDSDCFHWLRGNDRAEGFIIR